MKMGFDSNVRTAQFVQLPGLRMHYVSAGPADGTPIILLHGFPEFWYSWRYQIPALAAAGYRVIAPDQRGYNLTDKHGPYDIVTLANDIAHLQDALGLTHSHIVGHDWGGGVAWAFAALHPERTDKLIILNAPHFNAYADTVRTHPQQALKSWYILYFQLPFIPEWSLRRNDYAALKLAFRVARAEHMTPADLARYVEAAAQPGALSAALGWYRSMGRYILAHAARFPYFRINAPTCVLWGVQDFALEAACNDTLGQYVETLDVHYFPQASHWVQIDEPDAVNERMLAFLGG